MCDMCRNVYLLWSPLDSAQSPVGCHSVNMSVISTLAASTVLLASQAMAARVRRDDGYGAPEPDTYGAPAETYGAPVERSVFIKVN